MNMFYSFPFICEILSMIDFQSHRIIELYALDGLNEINYLICKF